ncbi:protein transport protein Sec24D [Babesia caballi]|uniref:Protein transport protein Sec24D n=1 Tax=Babesia caballi TaxID=5871 RepID=A0AAV4LWT5_BABCB|nr:protein transport protein Sec24D [Babesia caballi]
MACGISVPEPKTLKEALELLDVMHNSVGGSEQGVKTVFYNKLGSEKIVAFNNFQFALENASNLRARIVSYRRVSNYGSYGQLKKYGNDEACGLVIVAILKVMLPKLIETLEFLLKKVESIGKNHWGGQKCNGENFHGAYYALGYGGLELQSWLTDKSHANNSFRRGYQRHELSSHTGDAFKTFLEKLVKSRQNFLGNLLASIKDIATYDLHPQVNLSPRTSPYNLTPRRPNTGSGGHGQYGINSQHSGQTLSSQHPPSPPSAAPPSPHLAPPALPPGSPQAHHSIDSQPEEPPENQPSQNGAGSSTATIGGAVGGVGLVGGGAAVYFLNVGGIRTLIAG